MFHQRLADFDSVNVTGQSGDGGIDGLGVYRLGLVSFSVFFQCKRYSRSVSPSAVRDFRGAMAGRGDKGLLITTHSSTADAKKEATPDGAPPIDLIDGDRLCELLKRYDLGVRTTTRTVEDATIDATFFGDPVGSAHGGCCSLSLATLHSPRFERAVCAGCIWRVKAAESLC